MSRAKAKRKASQPPTITAVGPTPEFLAKTPVEQIETMQAGVKAHRAEIECKLDWYWKRELMPWKAYRAGMQFRGWFYRAGICPNQISKYGASYGGSRNFSDDQLHARERLKHAESWLKKYPGEYAIVERVCGHDEWAGGQLNTLRVALCMLAEIWGIKDDRSQRA